MGAASLTRSFAAAVLGMLAACSDGTGPDLRPFASCLTAGAVDARAVEITGAVSARIVVTNPTTAIVLGDTVSALTAPNGVVTLPVVGRTPGGAGTVRVTVAVISAAGDTVFRIGPADIPVEGATAGACHPVPAPRYTGPGARATGLRLLSAPTLVRTLDTFVVAAEAVDSTGAVVPEAPILWGTSGPAATVPDFRSGRAVAGSQRASATVVAELITHQTLDVTVKVEPPPARVLVTSGDLQTGTVGAPLAQPVDVFVQASDDLGVEGALVRFVAFPQGTVTPDSARSDSTGHVRVVWSLGTSAVTQFLQVLLPGGIGDTASAVAVAGAASRLSFAAPPRPGLIEGDTFGLSVVARDSLGNVAAGFAGPVTLALVVDPPGASLGGTATVSAVAGTASFAGLSVDRGGTGYALVATAPGLPPDTSARFYVSARPVALVFTGQPNNAFHPDEMASAFCLVNICDSYFRVAAVDRFGSVVTTFQGYVTVILGQNPVGAGLSLVVVAENGVARGSFRLPRGAGYTLLASSGALQAAESTPFMFYGESPVKLRVVTPYSAVQAGIPFGVRVSLVSAAGFVAAEVNGGDVVIRVDSGPSGAALTGTTRVPVVNGVAVFSGAVAQRVGRYWLSAVHEGTGLRSTDPVPLDIVVGPLQFVFSGPLPNRQSGTPFPVSVAVRDAFGNVGSYAGTVSLALGVNPSGATLGGTLTGTAPSGVAVFPGVTIDRPGTGYTLVASAPNMVAVESAPFAVSDLALAFATPPPVASGAGALPELVVEARDLAGNVATAFTDSVTLTLAAGPAGAALGGTTTVASVDGVARFGDVRVALAGTGYRLTASAAGAAATTSGPFAINPAAGVRLSFVAQPAIRRVGSPSQPRLEATVALVDSLGNADPSFTDTLTLRLAPHPTGSDTLFGSYSATPRSGTGLTSFSVTRPWVPDGGYRLIAEAAGFAPDTSAPFDVPVQFPLFSRPRVQPPATVIAGSPFSVSFDVVDADGFPLPDTSLVLLELGKPGGLWLGAIAGAKHTRGVAAFPGIVLQTVDTGLTVWAEPRNTGGGTSYNTHSTSFSVIPPSGSAGQRVPGADPQDRRASTP